MPNRTELLNALREQSESDEQFAAAVGVNGAEAIMAIAVRHVVAEMCSLGSAHVVHDSDMHTLFRAMQNGFLGLIQGWDFATFTLKLEREMNRSIKLRESDLKNVTRPG